MQRRWLAKSLMGIGRITICVMLVVLPRREMTREDTCG
jgi:hypothetical protein